MCYRHLGITNPRRSNPTNSASNGQAAFAESQTGEQSESMAAEATTEVHATTGVICNKGQSQAQRAYFQLAQAFMKGKKRSMATVLLDSGSDRSYITEKLRRKLDLTPITS